MAGGPNYHSQHYGAPHYRGHQHSHHGGGYKHHWPRHHHHHYYNHGPRYSRPYYRHHYYSPPASYYYYNGYYPGYWDRSYGTYYFSGGFSEPGFGYVFGTRGNW